MSTEISELNAGLYQQGRYIYTRAGEYFYDTFDTDGRIVPGKPGATPAAYSDVEARAEREESRVINAILAPIRKKLLGPSAA